MKEISETVNCTVVGRRRAFEAKSYSIDLEDSARTFVSGHLGPHGISAVAADLLDIGAIIYRLERIIPDRSPSNPIVSLKIEIPVREPEVWNANAAAALSSILELLGRAKWAIQFRKSKRPLDTEYSSVDGGGIRQVALFSAGLDSTSGIGTLSNVQRRETQLVSFYTRQKSYQKQLAGLFEYEDRLTQWREKGKSGRGRTFQYRSFFFLCLAAVTADSWRARKILQFENGILASAVPPTPSYVMTKHAHPSLHRRCEALFSETLGGDWIIENPFFGLTKRECVSKLGAAVRTSDFPEVISLTDTCWQLYSPKVRGRPKKPGVPCGVCIPCIIRRTAIDEDGYAFDLTKRRIQFSPALGADFRAYLALAQKIKSCNNKAEFYRVLPWEGKALIRDGHLSLDEIYSLFERFAEEFWETFELS